MTDRDRQDQGPEGVEPWGTTDGFDADPPWGVGEDSPMDEGSEPTAVAEGRRGERRAGETPREHPPAGRHGFGSVEPTRTPAAGPGAPPDPAPPRRSFPAEVAGEDLPDNALEEATGMRPEGISRRG
ncbi:MULTISPECIES: hypothetical protein [Micromonospora]|uniref:Uncharacterized protein n=1 Tax=Micromonospora gifhornensis TaxID=84594 RepID=A0ABQ4IEC1_9ACTN|nr:MULTISPECIES: hypothetical protein [Micromonospora]PMR61867.1 hypothetical protein C1A38_07215 [Verrucosispora sp. ts21]GIJ16260.1 hypothetical protein Vgi01_29440 [Micromonospora gifhornensis]